MKSGESVTAGKIEISGRAKNLIDALFLESFAGYDGPRPRAAATARSALESHIAELEAIREAARAVVRGKWNGPHYLGVEVISMAALEELLSPETPAVSASPSGGAK